MGGVSLLVMMPNTQNLLNSCTYTLTNKKVVYPTSTLVRVLETLPMPTPFPRIRNVRIFMRAGRVTTLNPRPALCCRT